MSEIFIRNKNTGIKFSAVGVKNIVARMQISMRNYYDLVKKNRSPDWEIITEAEFNREEEKITSNFKYYIFDDLEGDVSGFYNLKSMFSEYKINYYAWKLIKAGTHNRFKISDKGEFEAQQYEEGDELTDSEPQNENNIARLTVISKYPEVNDLLVQYNVFYDEVLNERPQAEKELTSSRYTTIIRTSARSRVIPNLFSCIENRDFEGIIEILEIVAPDFAIFYTDSWYRHSLTILHQTNITAGEDMNFDNDREEDPENEFFDFFGLEGLDDTDKYPINGGLKKLPYIYFKNGSSKKCLYKYLKKRFINVKRNKISTKTFNDTIKKQGNTLKDLKNFCKAQKINVELFDIFGQKFYSRHPDDGNVRKNIIAVIANQHIYPLKEQHYKKRSNLFTLNNSQLETTEETNDFLLSIDGVEYQNKGKNAVETQEERLNDEFFRLAMNFNYEAEKDLKMRAVVKLPDLSETVAFYDMKKAYYETLEMNKKNNFPIFTVFDIWQKYDQTEEINNLAYYSINTDDFNAYRVFKDSIAPAFLTQNFFHGFMIKALIKHDIIKKESIEWVKTPSFERSFEKYHKVIETVDAESKKKFSLYNGCLGRTTARLGKSKSFSPLNEVDVKFLLKLYDPEVLTVSFIGKNDSGVDEFSVSIDTSKTKKDVFLNLNSVSFYNFIVEFTTLRLLDKCAEVGFKKVVALKTDSFGVLEKKRNDEKLADDQFIYEKTITTAYATTQTPTVLNFKEIRKFSFRELKKTFQDSKSYTGSAGTGKSFKVKNEEKFDIGTTISNICVRNMSDGLENTEHNKEAKIKTLFRMLSLHNPKFMRRSFSRIRGKICWVDESAFIKKYYYNFFYIMASQFGIKFIFTFDVNQLLPIGETGQYSLDYPVFRIINGDLERLTENFRCSKKLLNFASNFNPELSKFENERLLGGIQKQFPNMAKTKNFLDSLDVNVHLCWRNSYKDMINEMIMERRKLKFEFKKTRESEDKGFDIMKPAEENEGVVISAKYEFLVSAGVRLIGNSNDLKNGIYKSDLYEVVKDVGFDDDVELLQVYTGKKITFKNSILKNFRVGFAFTIHSLQGLTITEKYLVHEVGTILKCCDEAKRILYVGITRAKKFNQLGFVDLSFASFTYYLNKSKTIRYAKNTEEYEFEDDL